MVRGSKEIEICPWYKGNRYIQIRSLKIPNSAFGISGGRSRMPDAHVEMLLDCYKAVQEERTLDSGRLGKGAFHQVILH